MIRNRLTKWRTTIKTLENPKDRPNDLQRLILSCLNNGLSIRDATRIFGMSQRTLNELKNKHGHTETLSDKTYFMKRARQLGADDAAIAQWFGIDRLDKVNMILADIEA